MNRPILKNRTIMKQFKNDSRLTLALMAENYGMPEDEFLEAIKKVCGKENFADLQKLNQKRIKAGKGRPEIIEQEDETMKARIKKDLLEQKANVKVTVKTSKEENTMAKENTVEKLQERLQIVSGIISTVEGEVEALNALQEATKIQITELEQQLAELRAEEADQAVSLQEKQAELENAHAERTQLQAELESLTMVILIAPRYKGGNHKTNLQMISTKGRDGIKEEKVPQEEWVSKPTWESFVNSGHKDRECFEEDFEFVQLVLKYQCEGKKFELKANDNVKNMIRFEGGEV